MYKQISFSKKTGFEQKNSFKLLLEAPLTITSPFHSYHTENWVNKVTFITNTLMTWENTHHDSHSLQRQYLDTLFDVGITRHFSELDNRTAKGILKTLSAITSHKDTDILAFHKAALLKLLLTHNESLFHGVLKNDTLRPYLLPSVKILLPSEKAMHSLNWIYICNTVKDITLQHIVLDHVVDPSKATQSTKFQIAQFKLSHQCYSLQLHQKLFDGEDLTSATRLIATKAIEYTNTSFLLEVYTKENYSEETIGEHILLSIEHQQFAQARKIAHHTKIDLHALFSQAITSLKQNTLPQTIDLYHTFHDTLAQHSRQFLTDLYSGISDYYSTNLAFVKLFQTITDSLKTLADEYPDFVKNTIKNYLSSLPKVTHETSHHTNCNAAINEVFELLIPQEILELYSAAKTPLEKQHLFTQYLERDLLQDKFKFLPEGLQNQLGEIPLLPHVYFEIRETLSRYLIFPALKKVLPKLKEQLFQRLSTITNYTGTEDDIHTHIQTNYYIEKPQSFTTTSETSIWNKSLMEALDQDSEIFIFHEKCSAFEIEKDVENHTISKCPCCRTKIENSDRKVIDKQLLIELSVYNSILEDCNSSGTPPTSTYEDIFNALNERKDTYGGTPTFGTNTPNLIHKPGIENMSLYEFAYITLLTFKLLEKPFKEDMNTEEWNKLENFCIAEPYIKNQSDNTTRGELCVNLLHIIETGNESKEKNNRLINFIFRLLYNKTGIYTHTDSNIKELQAYLGTISKIVRIKFEEASKSDKIDTFFREGFKNSVCFENRVRDFEELKTYRIHSPKIRLSRYPINPQFTLERNIQMAIPILEEEAARHYALTLPTTSQIDFSSPEWSSLYIEIQKDDYLPKGEQQHTRFRETFNREILLEKLQNWIPKETPNYGTIPRIVEENY